MLELVIINILIVWYLTGFIVFLGDVKAKKELIDDLKHKRLDLKSFEGSLYTGFSNFIYLKDTKSFVLGRGSFLFKTWWVFFPYERYLWEKAYKYLKQNYSELIKN